MQEASLITTAAETVLRNVSDEHVEQILLKWLGNLGEERQDMFLKKARDVVRNGIHPYDVSHTFHYLIVHAPAIDAFSRVDNLLILIQQCAFRLGGQSEITFLRSKIGNGELSDSKTVLDAAGDLVWAPDHLEVVDAVMVKNYRLLEGICFKLDDIGIYDDNGQEQAIHTPMKFNRLKELFGALVSAIHASDFLDLDLEGRRQYQKDAILPFRKMAYEHLMITLEFEIVIGGTVKQVLYCSPLPNK